MDKRDKRVIIFVAIIWIGIIMYSVFNPTPSYKIVRLDNDTATSVAEVVYVDDIPTPVQPLVRTIDGEPISSKPVVPWWNSPEIADIITPEQPLVRTIDGEPISSKPVGPWAGIDTEPNDDAGPGPVWHTSSKDCSSYEEYRELINSLKGE